MVDPDTTYGTHEEIETMRRTKDPIELLKDKMKCSGLADEEELNVSFCLIKAYHTSVQFWQNGTF